MNRRARDQAPTVPEPEWRDVAWSEGPRADRARSMLADTANRLFLERGYHAVRVEDIAAAAGFSRATFYVYYPSKRDVLLSIGHESVGKFYRLVEDLNDLPVPWSDADLEEWVTHYLEFLEHHGAFLRTWNEATGDDRELIADSHRQVHRSARRLGLALERLRGHPRGDATLQGIALISTLDGVWYQWRVTDMPHDHHEIVTTLASILQSYLR
jgi:AcrR family transcriptional regulator